MSLPLLAEGEFVRVKKHLKKASHKPFSTGALRVTNAELYFMLADLAANERNETDLRYYAQLAESSATGDNHQLFQAAAHRAWGVLYRLEAEFDKAESRLNQALELFEGLETHWQIGRTYYELAELALKQKEKVKAKRYFSKALASFEYMGAQPDIERIHQAMDRL